MMIEVAVVGVGGWGKNLARNYYQLPEANLRYICDLDPEKLVSIKRQYPGAQTTNSFDDVLADPELNAVVIATTGPTHYSLAKQALLAGKDVYVEKPFVLDVDEALELTEPKALHGSEASRSGSENGTSAARNAAQSW